MRQHVESASASFAGERSCESRRSSTRRTPWRSVRDGDTVASTGYGGNGTPDQLFVALEERFLATGQPRDLTLVFAGGQGGGREKGLNHLGHEGLLKRVIGGHFGLTPRIERLIVDNRIEAYNLPEGVITHLYRDIAAGKPGTLTRVGLGTFVDPSHGDGRLNARTTEDVVRLVTVDGEDYLLYRAFPIHVALLRGTAADPDGNVTGERESLVLENLALAIAARNSHGLSLCQVGWVAAEGSLDARRVRVPGILVDCVVASPPEHHMQTYGTAYSPAFSGEMRVPLKALDPLPLDHVKVIARRAAMELAAGSVINVGIGMPDNVARIAAEERIADLITLTVDPGVIGGVPMGGADFGAAVNWQATIDHCAEFDLIDGGGLDTAFLGFGECDGHGNVNASRFGDRAPDAAGSSTSASRAGRSCSPARSPPAASRRRLPTASSRSRAKAASASSSSGSVTSRSRGRAPPTATSTCCS